MDDKIPDWWKKTWRSWMDLCPELDLTSPAIVAEVTARRNAHNNAQAALHAADNNHVGNTMDRWYDTGSTQWGYWAS